MTRATARRRVCLVADDFGLHRGVDEAVLQLVEASRLQAFGCMTGGRSWRASAQTLRGTPPAPIDIGLHLDFTERPIGRPAQPLRNVIALAYARRLDLLAIRAEIRAQLNAFEAGLGRPPDYVDGHQHVHQLPGIRSELVAELEARYSLAERPWLRCTIPANGPHDATLKPPPHAPFTVRLKETLIATLGGYGLHALARQHRFAMNAGLLGVYGFDASVPAYQALMTRWLANAPDGAALMCHPALSTDDSDPIAAARLVEYQFLASNALTELLDHFQIETRPMRTILYNVTDQPASGYARDEVEASSEQVDVKTP
jgi:predicted glycoside hydrolase/deacetylase ChbG (UPF0249 family)